MEHTTIGPEVAAALAVGGPVVALESTIITHGLPRPDNLALARDLESTVRAAGAVPATIAVLDGQVRIGLGAADLQRLAGADVAKLSLRDLAPAVASGRSGGTTVAATAHLAHRAGIRVFATGGLGGVHRRLRRAETEQRACEPFRSPEPIEPVDRREHHRAGADGSQWDVSADLETLARTPIAVVCAGMKSILDIPATLERLETLGVAVVGYGTDEVPGFYLRTTGLPCPWRVDSPADAAAILEAHVALGVSSAVLFLNPVPRADAVDQAEHDAALAEALTAAAVAEVSGAAVTPFLLARLQSATDGDALAANIALARSNVEVAARIAVALTA